jgi:hypothetical protein
MTSPGDVESIPAQALDFEAWADGFALYQEHSGDAVPS